MEPISIALICAASFGTVMVIAAFVRQLLLSREKKLNDEAQRTALSHEANELEKIRQQMQSNRRFDSHYRVLGANKDAIVYVDNTIEQILLKKAALIERYAKISFKEAGAIVDGGASVSRKAACDRLRDEIDRQIKYYDNEIKLFQDRRGALWDAHSDLQEYLLAQEKARNTSLDDVYKRHSGILEKVYLRHIANTEVVAVSTIEAGTVTFKDMLAAPFQFLGGLFVRSTGVSLIQNNIENHERVQVQDAERELNYSASDEEIEEYHTQHPYEGVLAKESDDEFNDENYSIPIA